MPREKQCVPSPPPTGSEAGSEGQVGGGWAGGREVGGSVRVRAWVSVSRAVVVVTVPGELVPRRPGHWMHQNSAAWTTEPLDAGVMAAVAVRRVPSRYAPGGTPARAAALARNKSVRKSFKEVNAFRYSSFIDLLYFASRNEVCKALNKTRGLYQRWGELQQQEEGGVVVVATSREELDWTNTELRNALRSIEWDLEDLEETIDILL
ncbi:hypothetical protein O3P69_020014 [Scylla paramamosain]|uniref:Syntaxin 6/10/61 N-terminal domain-containing protein n=1 Tax=Scylla paramamosain TaxID=85552 RepID=A0AAW0TJZ9_SCYPA